MGEGSQIQQEQDPKLVQAEEASYDYPLDAQLSISLSLLVTFVYN